MIEETCEIEEDRGNPNPDHLFDQDPEERNPRFSIKRDERHMREENFGYLDDGTQFGEEYREWRIRGLSHFEARNKAVDWYRRHGSREVLNSGGEDGTLSDEEYLGADTRISPDEEVGFNLLVRKALTQIKDVKVKKYIVILCRANRLDEIFDEETWELANSITENYPVDQHGNPSSRKQDIARAVGYKVNAAGGSMLFYLEEKVRISLRSLFGDMK